MVVPRFTTREWARSESTASVARRLPSLTLEIALQFQMHVLGHYYVIHKHIEILSLNVISGNIFLFLSVPHHGNVAL